MQVEEFRKALGHRIRTARLNAEKTQQALAEDLGLRRTTVVNIERGGQGLTVDRLYQIANVLEVKAHELLPEAKLPTLRAEPEVFDLGIPGVTFSIFRKTDS